MSAKKTRGGFWSAYALGGVTVLAAALLWQGLTSPRPAYGQAFDSAKQRYEMIKELRAANKTLTEISGCLREMRDTQKQDKQKKDGKPAAAQKPAA
ncbi:MAG: hypothetical protein KAY37_09165 [Phycisphaerae bacterium]|nr:hypothetical protein [Phycisphaerae bacterium]